MTRLKTGKMRINPPTLQALRHITGQARERDRAEFRAVIGQYQPTSIAREMLQSWIDRGAWGGVFCAEDTPVAFLTALIETPKSLQVGLIATDRFKEIAVPVTRYVRRVVQLQLREAGFTRAECRCWEEHEDARRWLAMCGAREETVIPGYGARGETFIQLAWS